LKLFGQNICEFLVESSESADKRVLNNGILSELDILCRDEAIWQKSVTELSEVKNVTVNK
jgi:hypothetical protein